MAATQFFGERIKRNEDPRLLMGEALFTDDVQLPHMAHAAFVRSPYAHAHSVRIDVSEAVAKAGVLAVYTAQDLGAAPGAACSPDTCCSASRYESPKSSR
jgi:CO/xanthine dehydrogenase Mo-binding subunit